MNFNYTILDRLGLGVVRTTYVHRVSDKWPQTLLPVFYAVAVTPPPFSKTSTVKLHRAKMTLRAAKKKKKREADHVMFYVSAVVAV